MLSNDAIIAAVNDANAKIAAISGGYGTDGPEARWAVKRDAMLALGLALLPTEAENNNWWANISLLVSEVERGYAGPDALQSIYLD